MKTAEAKSTHSQQHDAAETSFFNQEQESGFFSERSPEYSPFFPSADTSSFIQPKYASEHKPFFQPTAVPFIQAKCAACEAEEREQQKEQSAEMLTVQRMPAFESEEAGIQRQPISSTIPLRVQRMPAFESEADDHVQTKPLLQRQAETETEPEEEASTDTELQTKLASNAIDPPEDEGESSENRLPFTQPKLTIGHPHDRYEREADAMADQIVIQPKQRSTIASTLQTKPIAKVITIGRQQPFKLQAKRLQRRPSLQRQGDGSLAAGGDIPTRLQSARGSGSRLDDTTRSRMESAFGADFSGVRVHTDSEAAQLNQDLGAQAFTHGSDIYFNEGKYNPASRDGEHLLAHELTHTVQQGATTRLKPDIQRDEEYSGAQELEASRRSARQATDPLPARQAKEQAEREGQAAEQAAEAQVPETPPPPAEPTPESPNVEQRVAQPEKKKPDKVRPATTKDAPPKGAVGQELDAQSANVCNQAAAKAQNLADNESAHDSAEQKSQQSEAAVEPPAEEGQSRADAQQVETLDQTSAPTSDPEASRSELNQAVSQHAPSNLDDLNNFKPEEQAKVMGNKVLAQTQKQVGEVQGTYKEIENSPPAPPPEPATPLPAIEQAPPTPPLNLGQGAVPDLKEEHVDVSQYEQQADDIYKKEGIGSDLQAEIEKVQDGELGEANKERADLNEKVATQPTQIKTFAKQQQAKVETDLQQEETRAKESMQGKRKEELEASDQKQKAAKSELHRKRDDVTRKIKGIYKHAETQVNTKLKNLEKVAMTAFDRGQAKYAAKFERNANDEIDAWKSDRYSGLSGAWTWVKDQFKDVGNFPEVQRIFNRHREAFIQNIDGLIVEIDAQNQKVIDECKQILADARAKIENEITKLGPALQKEVRGTQKDLEKKLSALDNQIEAEKQKLQQKLCDKKDKAIEAIDKKIEEMKEDMAGAVHKLGNLLLDAAIKFFKWALEKAGYSPEQLMSIINKGKTVIRKIVKNPVGFFKNIARAVGGGIKLFVANIKSHLIKGMISWLTGAMGDAGLQLPQKFDLKGIFSLMLQILGLTWTSIRTKLAKRVGEKVVAAAEKGVDIIKRVVTEGPIALWNIIKEKASEIKAQVMEGIRNWAIVQIVKKATIKLLSMLNPVGAIVQAIIAIYDVVMFFIDNWDRIVTFVKSIFSSISEIAMGQIGKAAAFIEKALAMTIPIILSFLARFLGLSGIGKAIRNVMAKVRKPVDKVVDKIVGFLAKQVKKLIRKAKKGLQAAKKKLVEWWKAKKKFKGKDGKSHTLSFKGQKKFSKLMISSTPKVLDSYLSELKAKNEKLSDERIKVSNSKKLESIELSAAKINKLKSDKSIGKRVGEEISKQLDKIATNLAGIQVLEESVPPSEVEWKQHGEDGKYMLAEPLSLAPGGLKGSEPYEESALWKKVSVRNTADTTIYIRGHLLNHHVHGPGSKKNLTPITGALNSKMEREVESVVKNKVLGEKKVVSYEVTAEYGGHPGRVNIPEEANLATSLKFELWNMEVKPGKDPKQSSSWKKVKKIAVTPSMTHNLPPDLPVGKLASVDFGNASSSDIVKKITAIGGIGEKPARVISELVEENRKQGRRDVDERDLRSVPALGKEKLEKIKKTKF